MWSRPHTSLNDMWFWYVKECLVSRRDVSGADAEVYEFGEFGDGGWDRAEEVGSVLEIKGVKEMEVGDGGWEGDRFREVKIVEIEGADALVLCTWLWSACDTFPCSEDTTINLWIPWREFGLVAIYSKDLLSAGWQFSECEGIKRCVVRVGGVTCMVGSSRASP